MSTWCVPCNDATPSRPNVVAMRFVPLKGHGNVPMCEPCWGGGQGPGMSWSPKGRPVYQDVSSRPAAAAPAPNVSDLISQHKGKLDSLAEEGKEIPPKKPVPVSPGRTVGRKSGGFVSTQDRDINMQKDRNNGMLVADIAEKYKVSKALVYMNTTTVPPKKKGPTMTRPAAAPAQPATPQSTTLKNIALLISELELEISQLEETVAALKKAGDILAKR